MPQAATARNHASAECMLGHGYYNKHSHAQGAANTYGLPLLVKAVDAIEPAFLGEIFRVADYGSAQGHNSLLPLKTTLSRLKTRCAATGHNRLPPVEVFHTDLPGNDWTTLFDTVFNSPDSYLAGQTNVFVYAAATSIYEQIFPKEHIAIGYSAIAVHWLSHRPCKIPGHIWSIRAKGEAREKWQSQARKDWLAFLESRSIEMISSGGLVIVGSGADSQGNSGAEPLMDLANQILTQMKQEHLLTYDELQELSIPTYYRTRVEWEEPLNGMKLRDGGKLKLVEYNEAVLPDVYLQQYKKTQNAINYAKTYAGFFRAAYEPCLFGRLKQQRPKASQSVVEEFFNRLELDIAQDPTKYSSRWLLSLMLIKKE